MNDSKTEDAVRNSNTAVLANAVELGAQVVEAVAGNAIANTLNGKLVNPAYLKEAIAARVRSILIPATGDR